MLNKFFGLSTLFITISSPATAATINITDSNLTEKVADASTTVKLNPLKPSRLAAGSQTLLDTLTANYPNWNFISGTAAPGTFYVREYDAAFSGTSGGVKTQVTYDNVSLAPTGKQFQWIQLIDTNRPLGAATNVYIDPRPNDDNLPFYWTLKELSNFSKYNTLLFGDFARREISQLPVKWTAQLYLVEWDGGTNVIIRDGISRGFEIVSNISNVNKPLTSSSLSKDKAKARIIPESTMSLLVWLTFGSIAFFKIRLRLKQL